MREIDRKLSEIEDEQVARLLVELWKVTGVNPKLYWNFNILQFIQQCIYPNGAHNPPIRITKECISKVDNLDSFLLLTKAGKSCDVIFRILNELLGNIENHTNSAIYSCINRAMIPTKKKPHHRHFPT